MTPQQHQTGSSLAHSILISKNEMKWSVFFFLFSFFFFLLLTASHGEREWEQMYVDLIFRKSELFPDLCLWRNRLWSISKHEHAFLFYAKGEFKWFL